MQRLTIALSIALAVLLIAGCEKESGCYVGPSLCAPSTSLWLSSEQWLDGQYEAQIDRQGEPTLSCSFELRQGGVDDAADELDAGPLGPQQEVMPGERRGSCSTRDGVPLESSVLIGRDVGITIVGEPRTMSVRITYDGEPVFEQEVIPDYKVYGEITRCSSGCTHADVELDLQL